MFRMGAGSALSMDTRGEGPRRRPAAAIITIATAVVAASLSLLLSEPAAAATTRTWTGSSTTSDNWSDSDNWSNGVPQESDSLTFPAASGISTNINDIPGLPLDTITFDGAHRITGSPVHLSGGIRNGATGEFFITSGVVLTADQSWIGNPQESWSVTGISGNHELTLTNNPRSFFISGNSTNTENTIVEGGNDTASNNQGLTIFDTQFSGPLTLDNAAFGASGQGAARGLTASMNSKVHIYDAPFRSLNGVELHDSLLRLATDCDNEDSSARLDVRGNVVLDNMTLEALPGSAPSFSTPWTIISNDGRDPISGSFNSLPEGATFTTQCGGGGDGFSQETTFRISYRGGDGNDVTLTRIDGSVGGKPIYLALGDSYSSGEGAPNMEKNQPPYVPDSNTRDNACHRSVKAYPYKVSRQVAPIQFEFHACSGAVIEDFFSINDENLGEPAQLDWIRRLQPKLITLTVGGNDVFFPEAMEYCARRSGVQTSCEATWDGPITSAINNLASKSSGDARSLRSLYRSIREAAPPGAKILVAGYPRFFPVRPPRTCATGVLDRTFQRSDMAWVNRKVADMNTQIALAIRDVPGLTFVNLADALNGHEICTSEPWMNRADLRSKTRSNSFHPNRDGHSALFKVFRSKL